MTPLSREPRAGSIHVAWLAFLASAAVLAVLIGMLAWRPAQPDNGATAPLTLYCAAGIKAPVEVIAREYQEVYGVPIQLEYGGSQTLLAKLDVNRSGDLYLPADDSYVDFARQKDLIAEVIPLAEMTPVIAVRKGNPKNIRWIADLMKDGVRLAQANPDAAAIGLKTREALQKTGQWDELKSRTTVFKPTVTDVASDVKVGTVDAGVVWDATVAQFPELEAVHAPLFDGVTAHISIAVLHSTRQPTAALRFARYLAARDKGLLKFQEAGFRPVEGDPWAEKPELRLLAGAMLRPAVEETITAFEQREGVEVVRVYNGCGILVGQMRVGERPDAYFACDKSFMEQVHDLFLDPVDVSTNQLVILVPKGNPHRLRSLRDLGKPGLRVGVGHEKQCALGVITRETLIQSGFYSSVRKNVALESPTGDLLVNQLRTGSLDAVVAYISNAVNAADELDAVKVEGIPCAVAVQPFAVGKESRYKQLTGRLRDTLRSQASRERFEANGFRWQTTAQ